MSEQHWLQVPSEQQSRPLSPPPQSLLVQHCWHAPVAGQHTVLLLHEIGA